ncbi:MAG: hypothetical protein HQM06_02935 [Magnetococcales bacterium]|nr:hypothetical protein [Magnetococcales bacterium]
MNKKTISIVLFFNLALAFNALAGDIVNSTCDRVAKKCTRNTDRTEANCEDNRFKFQLKNEEIVSKCPEPFDDNRKKPDHEDTCAITDGVTKLRYVMSWSISCGQQGEKEISNNVATRMNAGQEQFIDQRYTRRDLTNSPNQ